MKDNRHKMKHETWYQRTVKCYTCKHEFCSTAAIGEHYFCERCGSQDIVESEKELCDSTEVA